MTDNQQQQQMNVPLEKRSVGEILQLGAGGAVLGLLFLKGLHWAWPELFEDGGPGPG